MLDPLVRFVYFRVVVPLRCWLWHQFLKSAGGTLGEGAVIYEGVRIIQGHPDSIQIGRGVRLLRNVTLNTLLPKGRLIIGNNVHIGEGTMVTSHERIEIQDDVVIGPYNVIVDVDHVCKDRGLPISKQGILAKPICIKEGAWIASHCSILKGITIGRGAVVGAGSVVTRDVPDYTVVAGSPARVLHVWGEPVSHEDDAKEISR